MKFLILFFLLFSFSLSASLSKDDIEQIRRIVREEVQREISALRNETNAKIEGLRAEMNARFEGIDKRFEDIDKRFHWLYILLSSIIGLIGVMVGSVLWLVKQERPMSMKHYNEITKREKWLEKEIAILRKEVEELKPIPTI